MKGSEFVFDYVHLLLYKCQEINRNRGVSCIVKLELLTDIDMLLMAEKGITRGICHAIHRYAKANNRYMKNYDKNKESSSSYLKYWDLSNLYGWTMSQKLPVNNFEWAEDTFQINEGFINTIMNKVMKVV